MPSIRMIKSIINEYGLNWLKNRLIYSIKLKTLRAFPFTECLYEKQANYPIRLDLFDIDVAELRSFIRRLSIIDKEELIEKANNSCEGIITGFSSVELNYGLPIDWQLNPITGKRASEKIKWYNIPDFDKDRGDIKVIWEASRFSHLVTLARAFLLTDDIKYYNAFSTQLDDWLKKNPYCYGANYKCGQECSFRMVNTLLAYTIFKELGVATDADASNVKDLVDRCYRKVLSNFFYAYKCIKNNHTLSELMGIIVGAWCCSDNGQLDKAYKLLDKVIDEQFTGDGGYIQFSFNYQRLALQDLECIFSIERKTKRSLNKNSKNKVINSALLMYQCQDSTGDMPNYGSNDGALIFPLTSCGYRDYKPVINAIIALGTEKQLYLPGKHQEELIWFSGQKSINDYNFAEIDRKSQQFDDAGLFTFRNDHYWGMIVLNSYKSRPAHMDQLHFDLWVDGLNVLCDSGTFSYASNEGQMFARNDSHNTALVDGFYQMNVKGVFMVYDWTKRYIAKYNNCFFEGVSNSKNGYIHKRKIRATSSGFEIIDKVDKDYSILFHTPCDIEQRENQVLLIHNGNIMCELQSNGVINICSAVRSVYYLKKEPIYCISISGKAKSEIITTISIKGENKND